MLVALVVVDTAEAAQLSQPYKNLHLTGGVHCLWLSYNSATPGREWRGAISKARSDTTCDRGSSRNVLGVARSRDSKFRNRADYPPVARFSEDANGVGQPSGGQPLLGVNCLAGWCEFGPARADSSPAFKVTTPKDNWATREERIKGWQDEQLLDEWDPVSKTARLTAIRATIMPRPRVNALPASAFSGKWVRVATIRVDTPIPKESKFFRRWGLRPGSNRVLLRNDGAEWKMMIIRPAGDTANVLLNVHPMPHHDVAVPGTARWRWTYGDPGAWIPCGDNCCRSDDN
jgi:hypothetical protein